MARPGTSIITKLHWGTWWIRWLLSHYPSYQERLIGLSKSQGLVIIIAIRFMRIKYVKCVVSLWDAEPLPKIIRMKLAHSSLKSFRLLWTKSAVSKDWQQLKTLATLSQSSSYTLKLTYKHAISHTVAV